MPGKPIPDEQWNRHMQARRERVADVAYATAFAQLSLNKYHAPGVLDQREAMAADAAAIARLAVEHMPGGER